MEPVDPGWKTYSETLLELPDEVQVDFRQELDAAALESLSRLSIDFPFAVVSAVNPMGQSSEESHNEAAFSALRAEVGRRGVSLW